MRWFGAPSCLALLLTALCPAATAGAGIAPWPLEPVPNASGWFLWSDGAAEAAYGLHETGFESEEPDASSSNVLLVNTRTGSQRTIAPLPCGVGTLISPRFEFGGGWFLQICPSKGHKVEFVLESLRSGAVERADTPAPPTKDWFVADTGSKWVELAWPGSNRLSFFGRLKYSLFDPATGARKPAPQSYTTYDDLDAARPVRHLCKPVRRSVLEIQNHGPPVRAPGRVEGVSGGWVLLEGSAESLLAWHCGAPRARVLAARNASAAELGSGIATWIAGSALYAERLQTGRRWRWRIGDEWSGAVHTTNGIYLSENFQNISDERGERLLTASLDGL